MDREKTMQLRRNVKPYEQSDRRASIVQILNTFPPFFLLWGIALAAYSVSPWISAGVAVIAAGFLVRIFIIFHDCTHGSFFKKKKANDMLGTITGIMTLFPYEKWKREHSIHHATSGNLDKRGTGDIWVMTVQEFNEATPMQRLGYRLYRNPVVMFGFGPLYLLLVSGRFNRKDAKQKERLNTWFINAAVVVIYAAMILLVGWLPFLIIQGTILFVAGCLGIWLFYVQHQFEDSYFEDESEWNYVKAAVDGSSYYQLPRLLQWVTGNIGYHHVHHLAPRVPNYKLEQAHESVPPLQKATTITLRTSLESLRFKLFDEANKRFITFKEWRAAYAASIATSVSHRRRKTRIEH
ncbi:fatty acid desaturase [Bhargavaea cecembensis]|uniref:fatty acid desaturase n=1 Tax=Bhargavaea cecembensis TaxID=394098 RepID=UPI00058BAA42|nr:fatty acid desaturase [Bhargavaea cecembensis]